MQPIAIKTAQYTNIFKYVCVNMYIYKSGHVQYRCLVAA